MSSRSLRLPHVHFLGLLLCAQTLLAAEPVASKESQKSKTTAKSEARSTVQPTLVPKSEIQTRRKAIHLELDRNHESIQDLYEMLDATLEKELDQKSYLEQQIHQFDARNNVLFEELDAMDRHEFQDERKADLEHLVKQLTDDARTLRTSKQNVEAHSKETQAKVISQAIEDGRWLELLEGEWSCEQPKAKPATSGAVELFVENARLKGEVSSLREELGKLRTLVSDLRAQLETRTNDKRVGPATE